ncbi:MAG: MFS transporter [Armatimonadota bacterium]
MISRESTSRRQHQARVNRCQEDWRPHCRSYSQRVRRSCGRDSRLRLAVNRNVKTVLAVSILFGMSTGIYEFVLPFYLKERGLSYEQMGVVFAIAAAGMLGLRIVMGRLADLWGRKPFYGLALGGTGVAMWLTSLSASLLGQVVLKTVREAMLLTRDTLHPVVLYEESRGKFMSFLGKTRGFEFLFQAAGTIISGLTLSGAVVLGVVLPALGTGGNLRLAALLTGAAFLIFWLAFRESWGAHQRVGSRGLGELLSFDLHRNLKVIAISVLIFNIGLTTSHSFVMMLYFPDKFGVSKQLVSTVMVGHRLTIALPLLLAGTLVTRNLKAVYIWTLAAEGAVIAASAMIPSFYGAAGVWLLHDLIGAGVWTPIQSLIIQEHTRPETRALEMGKVLAFGGIGTILGPLLSGFLYQRIGVNAPFIASGVLMIVAAAALTPLRLAERAGVASG